jgi:transcriptional regulator with XRE-family HTH domain
MDFSSMEVFSPGWHSTSMKKILSLLIPDEARRDKVGRRITALREALDLSKAQFADSIKLDRSTLTKVEAGREGFDLARGMAVAYLYRAGLNYIYRGDLSDLPQDLQPKIVERLTTLSTKS